MRNKPSRQAGLIGTARVDRRTKVLIPRLRPGDIAVLDHLDLDRATAQALVDARVAAVLNLSSFLSGRYPALGPVVLAEAGILLVDRLEGASRIRDGVRLRIRDEVVFVDDQPVAMGREVDHVVLEDEMGLARTGLGTQLETFTHNSTEFLRREADLLLHGQGLPTLGTRIGHRPVVVVADGRDPRGGLRRIRAFLKERRPVLVGVGGGADVLLRAGLKPDIVVIGTGPDDGDMPSAAALRTAHDVVVRVDRGHRRPIEHLERLGIRAARVETSATTEDVGLLLAHSADAAVIVGVGTHATLDEFLDRQRSGLASTYLTRLVVGQRLVDAASVPMLYSGRLRPRHLLLALVLGLVAVAAAIATTPVGEEWAGALWTWLRALVVQPGVFS